MAATSAIPNHEARLPPQSSLLRALAAAVAAAVCVLDLPGSAQEPIQVRPIEPPPVALPSEVATADVSRFSFIVYGDTRSPVDGQKPQPEHGRLVDRMIAKSSALARTPFPVRFVLQTGDAVSDGADGAQWNRSFTPVIERLTRRAGLPYFFTLGNHDVPPSVPVGDPRRAPGLRNALAALSKLNPPEGSPRRLTGYVTYAFGFGNLFAIAIDSNIALDATQLAWVTNQLDHLDRARYRHVVAFFHHPILSSGPHVGGLAGRSAAGAADSAEPPTAAMRALYQPLFRKHHVRLTLTGHDHLYDHFIERYTDNAVAYRMDHLVTGGGGAPIYTYLGEPEVRDYLAGGAAQNVRLEHPMRPGSAAADNPHHFVVVQVDGDRLSLEVVAIGPGKLSPYKGQARVDLDDREARR